jgi:putative DNA primase/helicase
MISLDPTQPGGTSPDNAVASNSAPPANTVQAASPPGLFLSIEPWPEPVETEVLEQEIVPILMAHLVMSEDCFTAMALWLIFAHSHDLFRHSPYLGVQSPTMRCGKTSALSLVEALAPRPCLVSDATAASLFRLIDQQHPTLIFDELDQKIHRNADLRLLLNAAHNRASGRIVRTVKGEAVSFDVFGPKALASIGSLPQTVQDRAIVIALRRKRATETVRDMPVDPASTYRDAHRKLARLADQLRSKIEASTPPAPIGLNDRAFDNWRPLILIADALGGEWPERARRAAINISQHSDRESVDHGEQLVRDIRAVFQESDMPTALTVQQLHRRLLRHSDGRWEEFERGHPLTAGKLGRMLSAFGIASKPMRVNGKVARAYRLIDFEDVFSRYCPSAHDPEPASSPASNGGAS